MANISDLDLAVATLKAKCVIYDNLFAYYDGNQPIVYSQDRLRDIFKSLNARFTQNWCAVVIDSVHERIQLQRITVADNEAATQQLDDILKSSQLILESDDTHLAALVTGESYVIVWPDEATGEPDAYYNDPRNVHLFYEADSPRIKRMAAKWWVGDDGYRYLTLYYPDRLEYYRTRKQVRTLGATGTYGYNEVENGKAFDSYQANEDNEYGVVPVFHFRRDHRVIKSELANIIEPQDAVNKLLADMMIAAEFGAFPQRYIISQADPGKFKNAPNQIWDIPAGDGEGQAVSVGQFDATELKNYLDAIDRWTYAIAVISRTPKHYFFGQGGDPSGEALIAMEAPLNKKAQKYIDRFIATWSEIGAFLLQLDGVTVDNNAVVPVFDKPETVQPYTQALIRKTSVEAGVPLMWEMKQEGYTEQELDELEQARSDQQQQQQETLAAAMVNSQRNFDQNGNNGGNRQPFGKKSA